MDTTLKAKWVEALRSGKYQQARNYLRKDDGFCCLGVLCEISGAGAWVKSTDGVATNYVISGDESTQYLPWRVRNDSGLHGDQCDPLMSMNDEGKPFSEIADYIEANL